MVNPNADPSGIGLAQLSIADVQRIFMGQQIGLFSYKAGASGSVAITGRVLTILAHSTGGGSVVIDGGDTIPVPANVGFAFSPCGNLWNPVIDFNSTDMYVVELAI
jgi:hypothetical protein